MIATGVNRLETDVTWQIGLGATEPEARMRPAALEQLSALPSGVAARRSTYRRTSCAHRRLLKRSASVK